MRKADPGPLRRRLASAPPPVGEELKALVRTIPDFPKPGIQFRDITTLLLDRVGLARAVEALAATVDGPVDLVAAIEARGFAIGGALAVRMGAGLLLIRKEPSPRTMRSNMGPTGWRCMSTPALRARGC